MDKSFTIGSKTFILDESKAEAAYAAKKIINGRQTMTFNLLPLKYQWAYELYRKMKSNHWEPEDIPMNTFKFFADELEVPAVWIPSRDPLIHRKPR